jgi:hypothetical protein
LLPEGRRFSGTNVLKMLVMLVWFMVVSMVLVGLRQHRLEITSGSASIYDEIRDRRQTLLDQRVEIAKQTNPWALASALQSAGVNTGEALRSRDTTVSGPKIPKVETDLVAPVLGDGHANPDRPR